MLKRLRRFSVLASILYGLSATFQPVSSHAVIAGVVTGMVPLWVIGILDTLENITHS